MNQHFSLNGQVLSLLPNEVYIVNDSELFFNEHQGCNSLSATKFEEILLNQSNATITPYFLNGQVSDGLAVLELLCKQNVTEQPEFIDVNDLVLSESEVSQILPDTANIIDEDDDVIFVGEYRPPRQQKKGTIAEEKPRRNPTRKARNKRCPKKFANEIFYDDFPILDSTSEDSEEEVSIVTSPVKKAPAPPPMKKWPVSGLHERPEYNAETNTIEKFDYTIREIQKSVQSKMPEAPKKPIKRTRYVPRRRRKNNPVPVIEKTVKLSSLKPLINSTFSDFKQFCENVRSGSEIYPESSILEKKDELLDIAKNQALLFSLVNNFDKTSVISSLTENS